jgi:hypothetical protein
VSRAACGSLSGTFRSEVASATGHCYVSITEDVTQPTAKSRCSGRGGHLITITTQAENQIAIRLAGGDMRWIGLERSGGIWRWITGEPTPLLLWAAGEPDNDETQNCSDICVQAAGCVEEDGWMNHDCSFTRFYICENEP